MINNRRASHGLKKIDDMELSMLCHQLNVVLKSGINPLEGIPLIAEDINNSEIQSSLLFISQNMLERIPMFQAFSETGRYPDYMVHMIEIGEKTGTLETVMENLSTYYETEADIKKRMKSAIVYPIILGLLMFGVIALLILKIIPMFGEILSSLGGQVPKEAKILFSFALNMKSIMIWLIVSILFISIFFILFIKTRKGRFIFDRLKVENPVSGPLYRKIMASRLGQGLCITIQSGLNPMEGCNSMKGLVDNTFVNEQVDVASEKISQGAAFSTVIKETKLFPELFVRMIRTGERTGNLDSMMQKLSRVYAKEAELSLRKFSGSIEPIMVVILSVILGVVLLSVLLPLIGIMASIG